MTDKTNAIGPARALKTVLNMLDAALLLAVLLLPLAWFFDPFRMPLGFGLTLSVSWGLRPVVLTLALLAARLFCRARLRRTVPGARGWADAGGFRKVCMAVLPSFLMLVAMEAAAKWAGVAPAENAPIRVTGQDFAAPASDGRVVRDPELLFAFEPGCMWDGIRINRHGFRTWDFPAEKAPGVCRVICLGDSCTAQGHPPYSDRLNRLLQSAPPPDGRSWEAFNMGVFGYSSLQGYRQFLRDGVAFRPDVVTLYYGWNDHWTYGRPDRLRMAVTMSPLTARVVEALRAKRLYAALAAVVNRARAAAQQPLEDDSGSVVSADLPPPSFRVPIDEYEEVLTAFVRDIRSCGAVPLLVTAPRRALTETLVKSGHARSPAEAEAAHAAYTARTRRVAAATGADLLDLATLFEPAEFDSYFLHDGIHFTEDGLQRIAEELHAKLTAMAANGRIPAVQ